MMRMISAAIVVGPKGPGIGRPSVITGLALMTMPRGLSRPVRKISSGPEQGLLGFGIEKLHFIGIEFKGNRLVHFQP